MKPQEIFEHKMKWKPGFQLKVHSDIRWTVKDFCKHYFAKQNWELKEYTDVYEDTVMFEFEGDMIKFRNAFERWIV
jgi:hypothetical protein